MLKASLISVVMCTYNGEKYVDEQIESIVKQTYRPVELIIVDDDSADATWKKLKAWQKQSEEIKIFRNEHNIGYNKNFEKAIQLASGDFIALSDQDDIWLPEKLNLLLNSLLENDKNILAHGKSVRLEKGILNYKKANLQHHFSGNDTRKLFFFNQAMGHDMLFRKELVNKIIPIPEGMSYDWWIAVVATCYGHIASVNKFLTYHRIHETNSFFSSAAPSKKKEFDFDKTLQVFTTIPALEAEEKKFLEKLLELIQQHNFKNKTFFDAALFSFLYKYRKIIFSQKKRLVPEYTYLKNALKYAKFNYVGKGMSK